MGQEIFEVQSYQGRLYDSEDFPGAILIDTVSFCNLRCSADLEKTIAWYLEGRSWWEKQLWMRTVPIIAKSGKKELH